jgi:hypothetical protein
MNGLMVVVYIIAGMFVGVFLVFFVRVIKSCLYPKKENGLPKNSQNGVSQKENRPED